MTTNIYTCNENFESIEVLLIVARPLLLKRVYETFYLLIVSYPYKASEFLFEGWSPRLGEDEVDCLNVHCS